MVIAHGEYAGLLANEHGTSMGLVTSMNWTRQFRMKSNSTYEVYDSHRHLRNTGGLQEFHGQAHILAHEP